MGFNVDKEESIKGMINVLETLINTLKSDSWDLVEGTIDMENDIDDWAKIINSKTVKINMVLKPINYCTIGNVYIDLKGDHDE